MKKIILISSFAFLSIISTGVAQTASESETTQIAENKDGAKIEFESEVIDYGTIENKSDGNREFKFTNTGNEPLVISNAKGSCGCTVPTWPKEAIAPGESAVIKVRYATERTGAFTKSVTLTSNAINGATKKLQIKGTVKPPKKEAKEDKK